MYYSWHRYKTDCQFTKIILSLLLMIDGVKIRCVGTNSRDWENNPLLSFSTKVDEQTGEIKSDTKIAFYRGLYFFLIPSTIKDEVHCILRGSLPKYFNHGRDNAFDFTFQMLRESIFDIKNRFSIDPNTAIVQHFEYGVNIHTEKAPQTIIRGLRAFQSNCFTSLKVDEFFNGRQLNKQEYQYKVYDKGLQLRKKGKNFLRVELAVKSQKKAKRYGISVLADLCKMSNLEKIKPDLLKVWEEMIFYDSGMKWRLMNKKQKEKMLYYLDATNWEKFTRKQRFRAKNIFVQLRKEFCSSTTQEDLLQQLIIKLEELTAAKGNALRKLPEENETRKKERFTRLDKPVKRGQNQTQNSPEKKKGKSVKMKKPKCKTCGTDISHKRAGSIYCGKFCNNVQHAKNRKNRRHRRKAIELKNLNYLLKSIEDSEHKFKIFFIRHNKTYFSLYHQHNICLIKEDIQVVKRMEVYSDGDLTTLTSYRARRLLKVISQLNYKTQRKAS
ncbi:hypothetical protein RM545_12315 [Zunongwangia sp. F260]|uniref:Uncharacterized protein n=1 Tax=Autumnicola lenta TaxID=3075593 RepID=A0ABU3CM97_9FLAO|nr:hypothetical protein [Zunongwangia sp. F260]MDT0647477.1 hypothetical protein [Zunongwangia sp. F260]